MFLFFNFYNGTIFFLFFSFWTIKAVQFRNTFFGVWSIISGYSLEINYYMQFTRP